MREASCRPILRDERGAAAVEFALIIGLLLTVLFAIVQFGRAYSEVVVLTGAAREGARLAAVRCGDACDGTEVEERVQDAAEPYEVNGSIAVAPGVCTDANQGDLVTVSWTQTIEINVIGLAPMTKTPEIKAAFRCE